MLVFFGGGGDVDVLSLLFAGCVLFVDEGWMVVGWAGLRLVGFDDTDEQIS